MITLLITVCVLGVLSLWGYRVEQLIRDGFLLQQPGSLRPKHTTKPGCTPPSGTTAPEQIPPDLYVEAQLESEEWAKQEKLDAMYELYQKVGDWSKVREALHPTTGTY